MIVTISGMPGSGKSTVGRILARRLGYRFFSAGDFRGRIALSRGITIDELNEIGRKERWTDEQVDSETKRLGETVEDLVVDGWIAFHFIPRSLKVFLDVDPGTGARRICKDQRPDERRVSSEKEALAMLRKRVVETVRRYRRHYGVDITDRRNYDLVIDTTGIGPEEAARRIENAVIGKGGN